MDNDDLRNIPPSCNRLALEEISKSDNAGDQPEPDVSPSTETDDIVTSEIQPHPYADMFPRMHSEAFDALVASIREDGLDEPIVIYEEKILDGRNRYAACTKAGAETTFVEYEGDDPFRFVLRKNLHRRHLTASHRAMIAARMANLGSGQHASQKCEAVTLGQAAETLNVSPRSVDNAKVVMASGNDELIEAVESGDMSVSAAAKKVTQAITPPSKPPGTPLTEAEEQSQKLLKLWDKTEVEGRALFLEAIGEMA